MSKQYVIEDWAGNRLFPDKSFPTFEDGWSFLLEKFPNEEDLQDYFVV